MASNTWDSLPEELLLKIFFFLDAKVRLHKSHERMLFILCQDVARVGRTCRKWQDLSADDVLWRKIILRDFQIEDRSRLDSMEASSWRAEYQRMVDQTPEICTEVDTVSSSDALNI